MGLRKQISRREGRKAHLTQRTNRGGGCPGREVEMG